MDYKFFIQEMILLPLIIIVTMTMTTYLRKSLSIERVLSLKKNLSGFKGYVIGSLFGAVTPFCSCSSVPVFMGISQMGITKGPAFSFLITSPLVHDIALVMFWQLFGWKVAIFYLTFSLLLGILGGIVVDVFKLDQHMKVILSAGEVKADYIKSRKERLVTSIRESFFYLKKVLPIIAIGIGFGSFMHDKNLESLTTILQNSDSAWYVILAVIVGIPLYSGIAVGIPIAHTLIASGLGLGTGLAFILSVAGLSLPEMIMLKSVMKTKLLVFFIAFISVGIILAGTSLNLFEAYLIM